ncbi:MAG: hypothetical protein IPJ40_22145 [Saprospirales bacterium]|nr:hypothetical protein [Saprospirales bacterium]
MKRWLLLSALLVLFTSWTYGQIIYEDFEGGVSDLNWTAAEGTYNGVVANTTPDAVNGSAFCGSYTKADFSSYSLFWVTDYGTFDLSEYNQFKLQVYSTVATSILLKLEGPGGNIEKSAAITQTGEWVEYSFDFSAAAGNTGLEKLIIFFDPGVTGSSDTYLFDNLVAYKPGYIYEDFEGGAKLTWGAINGSYDGVVANPEPNVINSSVDVGAYTNNPDQNYNFALADLGTPMDLSVNNQFKINVYAPAPTQVLLKLEGTGGNIEATKNIAVTNAWQEYTFDFSAAAANLGLTKILIVFAPGEFGSTDTYLFDNLRAEPKGACTGAPVIPQMIDDFECNRNAI